MKTSTIKTELSKNARQYTMVLILVAIAIVFAILTGGTFLTSRNISNLFLQASAIGIVAISVSLVLVAGEIDLSIGSCVGLTGAVAATLMVNMGWSIIPTILVTVAVGVGIGCWQGFWVAFRKVPSFIVTLAGSLIFRGIVYGITRGMTIAPMTDEFKAIGQGYIPPIFSAEGSGFNDTAIIIGVVICVIFAVMQIRQENSRKRYHLGVAPKGMLIAKIVIVSIVVIGIMAILSLNLGLSYAFLLLIILAVLFSFISNNTAFGRQIYAIGGNREAARLSGINIKKRLFLLFVVMGTMCAASGIVYTARINAGTAAAGQNMELDAIAAAVIGGTSTMGGEGSVFGAVIGALIMTAIDNGMSLMNLDNTFQYVVKGLVLLLAVWMDVATRKKVIS
ncbi:sugar ABC transporter permease [Christensenella hongkongensis]|uniref:Xylose transport system permease protein XylH n=1 Tax=Christensenella hongkongensis TaxID=270498 RepID=A0A0M2NJQ9_9FIRM|nr:sugar ABC transporter permease [Christensenella hongkongensis]KKI52413.1 Xylose ABC transporter, permease protein XylH [Christensenella hongkongensis]KUJ26211.1 sugar ABC transporter permease [Christensenella hongkongensis]TCW23562.1 D-xylose transport system permease protein [Christensenella hongkongensis]